MNMLRAVMAGLCVVSLCAGAAQAKPSVHPVGTLRYDPAKCWNSYVILANEGGSGGSAKLIDRNGNLVHEWDQKGGQGFPNKVYPGGYLLTSLYPGLSTPIRVILGKLYDRASEKERVLLMTPFSYKERLHFAPLKQPRSKT